MNKTNNNPLHYFSAKAAADTLVLDVMDVIGGDMFGQGITALQIKAALDENTYSDIQLNINSPGGDAMEGVTAYNVLRATGKPIAVNVVGMAASAASIVMMAGDSITMFPGSTCMIHGAMSICAGFAVDMRKMADVLDTVTESIADIYVARTKNSKRAIMEWVNAELWMNPQDAVKNGFATEIGKHPAVKNSFDLSAFNFKNVPEELKVEEKVEDAAAAIAALEAEILAENEPDPRIDIYKKKLELLRA
jgi:ATP-dependent Clp protease protease subunit